MADEREPSRKDLADALAKANELNTRLAARLDEQDKTIAELKAAKPVVVPQPGVQKVPYSGYVRAKEPCHIGHLRAAGEVFQHDAPCLWSDDPFEPVIVLEGTDKDGQPNCKAHPEAPKPIPFHLRPRTVDALSERGNTPVRASEW